MAQDIGTVYVQVQPSGKGFGKAIEGDLGDAVDKASKAGGKSIISTIGGAFGKVGKLGMGAVTAIGGGIVALAAKGGFERALNIENAQAKLKGLGHDSKSVTEIMSNALASVKGTAFGLGDAATVAASLSAAGVKSGEEMTNVLKTVADTAQISGRSLTDIGTIFGSVAARGKLQGDDMLQLMSSGVPVLQLLANHLGTTSAAVSDMVSSGQIDFATFAQAMQEGMGGAALKAGDTFTGALANTKAALSRLGESFGTPVLNALRDVFNQLIPVIDGVDSALGPLADTFAEGLAPVVQRVTDFLKTFSGQLADGSITLQDLAQQAGLLAGAFAGFATIGTNVEPILDVFTTVGDGAGTLVSTLTGNKSRIEGVVSGMGGVFSNLGTRWSNALGLIDANFGGIFGLMSNRVKSGLGDVGTTLVGLFDSKVYVPIQQGVSGIGAKIAAPFQSIAEQVGGYLSPVTNAFGTAFQGFGSQLAGPLQAGLNGLGTMISTFFNPANFLRFFGIGAIVAALVVGLGALNTAMGGQLDVMIQGLVPKLMEGLATVQNWVASNLPSLMESGVSVLTAVMQGLNEALPQIVAVAAQVLTTLVNGLAAALPTLIPMGVQVVTTLVQALVANLPAIIAAGLNLLNGLVTGIVNAIPQLVAALPQIITAFVNGIASRLPQILTTGVNILLKLVNGIINALPQLIAAAPRAISAFINGITPHLPQLIATGLLLIVKLALGLVQAIPQLVGKIPQIVKAIVQAFKSVDWGAVGLNIIRGIARGLTAAAGEIVNAAKKAASNALNAAKNALGIHSPSRVFRDQVGVMIGRGMALGIDRSQNTVNRSMGRLADMLVLPDMTAAITPDIRAMSLDRSLYAANMVRAGSADARSGAQVNQSFTINANDPTLVGSIVKEDLRRAFEGAFA